MSVVFSVFPLTLTQGRKGHVPHALYQLLLRLCQMLPRLISLYLSSMKGFIRVCVVHRLHVTWRLTYHRPSCFRELSVFTVVGELRKIRGSQVPMKGLKGSREPERRRYQFFFGLFQNGRVRPRKVTDSTVGLSL